VLVAELAMGVGVGYVWIVFAEGTVFHDVLYLEHVLIHFANLKWCKSEGVDFFYKIQLIVTCIKKFVNECIIHISQYGLNSKDTFLGCEMDWISEQT